MLYINFLIKKLKFQKNDSLEQYSLSPCKKKKERNCSQKKLVKEFGKLGREGRKPRMGAIACKVQPDPGGNFWNVDNCSEFRVYPNQSQGS